MFKKIKSKIEKIKTTTKKAKISYFIGL